MNESRESSRLLHKHHEIIVQEYSATTEQPSLNVVIESDAEMSNVANDTRITFKEAREFFGFTRPHRVRDKQIPKEKVDVGCCPKEEVPVPAWRLASYFEFASRTRTRNE